VTQETELPPPAEGDGEEDLGADDEHFDAPSGPRIIRPTIRLSPDLGRTVAQACHALRLHRRVFQRARQLVRVVRCANESEGIIRRVIGAPTIAPIVSALFPITLQDVADWQRYDVRSKEWVATVPPSAVCAAVLAQQVWEGIRPLVGISEWPFMRPDGSIVQGPPTYDHTTGYIYAPTCAFPLVPDDPTTAQLDAARDTLLEVVCDFPFATDAHRSAWLALLLTVLARPAIDGCVPFFPVDASLRGTGKTRIVDVTSVIVTGRAASKMPQPQDNEEMRKALTAVIVEGDAMCCFDNINPTAPFSYESFDLAVTTQEWKDRILATNTTIRAPIATVFTLTGNNIEFGGDTIRRALPIRLESTLESPQTRTGFRHADLCAWALAERPRLLAAALTILRAWVVSGRPHMGCLTWGSFEPWARMIPPAIVHAGLPDPMAAQEALESEGDPKRDALRVLLGLWPRLLGGDAGTTAKQAILQLYDRDKDGPPDGFDSLRDAIEELAPPRAANFPPDARKLGIQLRGFKHRVVRGMRLEVGTSHAGTVSWRVRKL